MSTAQRLGASVLSKLRKSLGTQVTVFRRSPLEVIVLNLLAENATQRQARQALDILLAGAVDWNEIRISRLCELTPRLADLNIAGLDRKLTRIQRFLSDVFDRYHRLSLDDWHHMKQSEVNQVITELGDLGPQGQEAVYQYALSYQAVALWPMLRRAAAHFKVIKAGDSDRAAIRALQTAVDKEDLNEFCLLLTEYGEMHLPPEPAARPRGKNRAKTSKNGAAPGKRAAQKGAALPASAKRAPTAKTAQARPARSTGKNPARKRVAPQAATRGKSGKPLTTGRAPRKPATAPKPGAGAGARSAAKKPPPRSMRRVAQAKHSAGAARAARSRPRVSPPGVKR